MLVFENSRFEFIADDSFVAKDCIFDFRALIVSGGFLPVHFPVFFDKFGVGICGFFLRFAILCALFFCLVFNSCIFMAVI